jgi:hypothetical protein
VKSNSAPFLIKTAECARSERGKYSPPNMHSRGVSLSSPLKWRRAEEEVEVLSHKQLVGASTPGSAVGLLVGARDLDAAGGRGDLSGAENAAVVAPLFPPPAEYEHTVEKDK